MAVTNFLRLVLLALALVTFSVQAAPARLTWRDLSPSKTTTTTTTSTETATSAEPASTSLPSNSTGPFDVCNPTADKSSHANPQEEITLYRAIRNDFSLIAKLKEKSEVKHVGDFGKAFYATDSKEAAAQLGCWTGKHKKAVAIFKYTWKPGSASTFVFGGKNALWKSLVLDKKEDHIKKNDMIAGPVREQPYIHEGIWQYAITNPDMLANLKLVGVERPVRCRQVPKTKLC